MQVSDFDAQAVLAALNRGSDAATPLDVIVERLGSTWTRRDVKRAIQDLRLQGHPIATSNDGVWLATAAPDLDPFLERSRSQIFSMWRTYRAVRRTQQLMSRSAIVQQELPWVA